MAKAQLRLVVDVGCRVDVAALATVQSVAPLPEFLGGIPICNETKVGGVPTCITSEGGSAFTGPTVADNVA